MASQQVRESSVILDIYPYSLREAFSGLRVYALTNRNAAITTLVVVLSLVPLGTNVVRPLLESSCRVS